MPETFDLIAIGSGSGGNVGAHWAGERDKKVAIVEKDTLGGECPNFACVPTKALLHAAEVYATVQNAAQYGTRVESIKLDYPAVKHWKDRVVANTGAEHAQRVFKSEKIRVIKGEAKFLSPHELQVGHETYRAHKFLIATGSKVIIPPVPGLSEAGFLTFREAVDLTRLPSSIFILGGGAVGCEFAQIFSTFGSKVYIADLLPHLLAREEAEVCNFVQALFQNRGMTVLTDTAVAEVESKDGKKIVHYTTNGTRHTATVDEILIAAGKAPATELDLEKAGVAYNKHGIIVNQYLQTTAPHIYAAGDVVGPFLFTHAAAYQSYVAAHNAFSYLKMKADYSVVPRSVFINPEVASVGITIREAKEKGIRCKQGVAPISVLGRANAENMFDGFVKVITDAEERIIGAAIVAPRAGELIHEFVVAMKLKAKASDIAGTIHAYPTYSEAVKIACSALEWVK
jgi:dihydrolipoamide dehydrogenase